MGWDLLKDSGVKSSLNESTTSLHKIFLEKCLCVYRFAEYVIFKLITGQTVVNSARFCGPPVFYPRLS